MNILVTGSNGQLGNELRIAARDAADRYIFTDVTEQSGVETTRLDITDFAAIQQLVKANDVKCIINCAAYTNVDRAETGDQALCHKLNAEAPALLAKAMKEVDGTLIHVSTDYVFGADPYNTPCKEDQKGTPCGVYGKTKLEGEENIKASGAKYLIFRTAWLYSEFGKNFVKTMLTLTSTKPALNVVFDQCGTPTYAGDLAALIYNVVSNRKYEGNVGVYHFSNEGVCSWYDFTVMIADIAGNKDCKISPCHSDEFPSPVTRPAYSVLDKTKVKATFDFPIPHWIESLKLCIANLKK